MSAPLKNEFYKMAVNPGRPKAISDPEIMWGIFLNYKEYIKSHPVKVQDFVGKDAEEVYREKEQPLTGEGFENWVADHGGPWSLEHYFMNYQGRYEDFIGVCARIKREIRADQIKGGLVGLYNPSVTQRLNNLVERTENNNKISLEQSVDLSQLSDEALKELDDASKNQPRLS